MVEDARRVFFLAETLDDVGGCAGAIIVVWQRLQEL